MTVRPLALLAALTLLPALPSPAFAQEGQDEAVEPADDPAPAEENPADIPSPPPADAPTDRAAEPAETPVDTPAPAGSATPAVAQPPPPSPFSPQQRAGWLAQCRATFQRAGAALGGAIGQPDACETQLLDFERTYVPTTDGQPPTIWVRVPVVRPPAAAPLAETPAE